MFFNLRNNKRLLVLWYPLRDSLTSNLKGRQGGWGHSLQAKSVTLIDSYIYSSWLRVWCQCLEHKKLDLNITVFLMLPGIESHTQHDFNRYGPDELINNYMNGWITNVESYFKYPWSWNFLISWTNVNRTGTLRRKISLFKF